MMPHIATWRALTPFPETVHLSPFLCHPFCTPAFSLLFFGCAFHPRLRACASHSPTTPDPRTLTLTPVCGLFHLPIHSTLCNARTNTSTQPCVAELNCGFASIFTVTAYLPPPLFRLSATVTVIYFTFAGLRLSPLDWFFFFCLSGCALPIPHSPLPSLCLLGDSSVHCTRRERERRIPLLRARAFPLTKSDPYRSTPSVS